MMRSTNIQPVFVANHGVLSRGLGGLALAAGAVMLAGWALDNASLAGLLPILKLMKANTALCLALSGAVLAVRERDRQRRFVQALAWGVFAIGVITLVEWTTGWNLRIDQAMLRDTSPAVGVSVPGRMAPTTAFCFAAIGAALLLLGRPSAISGQVMHALALLVGFIALLSLIGYIYGVGPTFRLAAYTTQMALPTALGLAVLSAGIQLSRPEHGLLGWSSRGSAAGMLIQQLLPLAIVLPIAIGWIRLQGQRAGLYDTELGLALYAASNVVVFATLITWSARKVHVLDAARASAVRALRTANEELDQRVVARTHELFLANTALRESTALWRAIVDSANVSIISTSTDGLIREFNPAAERLLGYAAAEVIAKVTPQLIHDAAEVESRAVVLSAELGRPIEPGFEALVARARSGVADEREWTYVCKDGRRIPISLSVTAMLDSVGTVIGFLGIAYDLTERKRAEAEIIRAKDTAETAMRARSNFLARMSHEIRTPLNGVLGMLDLALHTELDAEQREYLETSRLSADTLLAVIGDILDFSKMDAGKLKLESIGFGLQDCLGAALRVLAKRAHDKQLELLLDLPADIPDRLMGDPQRLRQIVINLVSNAIKFTDQGEIKLVVTQQTSATTDVKLLLRVIDRGIGIAADKQAEIFEAFSQVEESIARRFGGTGLGLAICSQLVALMGGRIGVESTLGRGSTFWFELAFPIDASASLRPDAGPVLHDLRVLIADNHADSRRILSDLLSAWHMRPVGVPGAEAVNALRASRTAQIPFDVVLLDEETATKHSALIAELDAHLAGGGRVILLARVSSAADSALAGLTAARLTKPVQSSTLLETMQMWFADPVAPGAHPQADEQPPAGVALRILVAEDAIINQRIARALLARAGHDAVIVDDGKSALHALAHGRFDLVLMDVQMPVMDGLQATRAIRASEQAWSRIPIVALTAQAMSGDRERCLEAGMDGYTTKPFNYDTLCAEIERVMAERRSEPVALAASSKASAQRPFETADACFDRVELLHRLGGSEALFEEVATLFGSETLPIFEQLRAAVERTDRPTVEARAHKLRGALLSLAATPAAATALAIEVCARDDDLHNAGGPVAALAIQLEALGSALLATSVRVP